MITVKMKVWKPSQGKSECMTVHANMGSISYKVADFMVDSLKYFIANCCLYYIIYKITIYMLSLSLINSILVYQTLPNLSLVLSSYFSPISVNCRSQNVSSILGIQVYVTEHLIWPFVHAFIYHKGTHKRAIPTMSRLLTPLWYSVGMCIFKA